ncbi:MAG: DUF6442 family protein [Oscillospiraceae bacterium]|nr:DUF6442 family protein [Oscillospiraceae bacterium]
MTKEEILEKSRQENKGADLAELEVANKSKSIAGAVAMVLGAVVNIIYTFLTGKGNQLFWVMFFGYNAAQCIVMGILYRKHEQKGKDWTYLGLGIVFAVLTILAMIYTLRDMGVLKFG